MQIFGPTCTQAEFFEGTISSQVHDFVHGKNALVFSYGVTNAGKTYTIQGELNRHSHMHPMMYLLLLGVCNC